MPLTLRKIFFISLLSFIVSFTFFALVNPLLTNAYTITEDLSVTGNLKITGTEVTLGSETFNQGKYMVFNLNQGGSKIYDDVHLHITTDDYLFLNAGKRIYNTTDLEVWGEVTAHLFQGDVIGDVEGYLTGNISGTSRGLRGVPSITINNLTTTGTITLPNNSLTDAMVSNLITASNYLPLSGGNLSGNLILKGSLLPYQTETYNLGSLSRQWQEVYATTLRGNLIGNVTGNISGTAGGLSGTPSITVNGLTAQGTITFPDNSLADSMIPNTITAANYLLLTGGTLTGNVNLGTNNILNSGSITANSFTGDLTGDVVGELTGNVTGNVSGTAEGLTGSPSITISGLTMATGATNGYVLTTNGSGVASWSDISATGGPWTLDGTSLYPDDTSYNVGIGTTNPGQKLEVSGDSLISEQLALHGGTVNNNYGVNIGNLSGGQRGINVSTTANASAVYAIYNTITNPATSGASFGLYNNISGDAGADFIGVYNVVSQGKMQGLYNVFTVANTGYALGVYNNITLNSGAGSGGGVSTSITNNSSDSYPYGVSNTITDKGDANWSYGVKNTLSSTADALSQTMYGTYTTLRTYTGASDVAYGEYIIDTSTQSTGGTQYGLYVNLDDVDVTHYSIFIEPTSGISYFGSNVGVGTTNPTSALHTVASGSKTTSYIGNYLTNTATSSTASINKTGLSVESTGTWNGLNAINRGLYVNATGGTRNYAALFNGQVIIGDASVTSYREAILALTGTVNGGEDYAAIGIELGGTTLTPAHMTNAIFINGDDLSVDTGASNTIPYAIGLGIGAGAKSGSGTITNTYGLYISNSTAGTNNYGAYIAGSVGIGTATPKTKLEVTSVIKSTPTDSPGTCDANSEGGMYYDNSMNEPCFCDGINWKQFDGGGNCT